MARSDAAAADAPLLAALGDQAVLGILGLDPAEAVAHSRLYEAPLAPLAAGARVVDLGSGAGIPGLVIAWDRADLRVTLIDGRRKRTDQLERLVRRLGLRERVDVVWGRAGAVAGEYDALVARRFGPPASVLGAADRLVRADGFVVVSAAPDDRWDGAMGDWVRQPSSPSGLVVLRRSRSDSART